MTPRTRILAAGQLALTLLTALLVSGGQSPLDDLKRDLQADSIRQVRVLFLDYDVLTRTALTPVLLLAQARANELVTITPSIRAHLIEAIEHSEVKPGIGTPDLRWGALFYDATGAEAHSIYLNGKVLLGTGRQGILDGQVVRLNGALIGWFESQFGHLMRRSGEP